MLSFFKRTALLAAAILFVWNCSADDITALLKKAESGDKEAQYQLALKYRAQKNTKKALEWAIKASKRKKGTKADPKYAELLAQFYEEGVGFDEPQYRRAFYLYRRLANEKSKFSEYKLGMFYKNSPGDVVTTNPGMARAYFERAAKQDYAPAQYELAMCYKNGFGIRKNPEKCVEILTKAAEAGHARAQAALGRCYFDGFGVEVNWDTAREWYEKAAEQKDSLGLALLGETYYLVPKGDRETKPDYRKAFNYFMQSTKQPNPCAEGMFYLGNCYYFGYGTGKNILRAMSWWEGAARLDLPEAQSNLGFSYLDGDNGQKHYDMAVNLFRKAAKHKNAKAQYGLSKCYQNGYGLKPNAGRARQLFMESAKNGYDKAQYELAYNYWEGKNGFPKDFKQALYWYELAAENGYWKAQVEIAVNAYEKEKYDIAVKWLTYTAENDPPVAYSVYLLALCYKEGKGVEKDLQKAEEWMQKAFELNVEESIKGLEEIREAIKKEKEEAARKAAEEKQKKLEEEQKQKELEAQQKEAQADNPPPAN